MLRLPAAAVALLFAAAPGAWAKDAPAGPLWNKVCGANGPCAVEQFVVALPQKAVMVHVQFSTTDKPEQTRLLLQVPLGVLLPPGVTLSIDGSAPIALPFERCTPQGCVVSAVLDKTALAKFTGGKVLTVHYVLTEKATRDFPVKLDGLAAGLHSLSQH